MQCIRQYFVRLIAVELLNEKDVSNDICFVFSMLLVTVKK